MHKASTAVLNKMRPAFYASVLLIRRSIVKVSVDLRGFVERENDRQSDMKKEKGKQD